MSNIIEESSSSLQQDFLNVNQEFIAKGFESCFKTLNTNLFSTINSSFANINNDYERKLDKNREIHERAVDVLTSDLKKIKALYTLNKERVEKEEESIENNLLKIYKVKIYTKLFRALKFILLTKKYKLQKEHMIVERYFKLKRAKNILISWRNVSNLQSKSRIKLKYSKIFTEKCNEIQSTYLNEIKRLEEVLSKMEIDINKEIKERKALHKLYDSNMNKGVEVFLKETNALIDFNSSSIVKILILDMSTPNERSFNNKTK